MKLNQPLVKKLIELAIEEDIGNGDVTTTLLVPESHTTTGQFIAKQDMVVAGLPLLPLIYSYFDDHLQVTELVQDGDKVSAGTVLVQVEGKTRALLTAERICLNFFQRCSGIATLTHSYIMQHHGSSIILDTRKTTPGWRIIEKYAVRVGGAHNHRMGLYDGILIKDNHIAIAGSVERALQLVNAEKPTLMKIEVEVDDLAQVIPAVTNGADVILLDNMAPQTIKEALSLIHNRCQTEISGGVTLDNLETYSHLGVTYISIGALTHQARSVDISFDLK